MLHIFLYERRFLTLKYAKNAFVALPLTPVGRTLDAPPGPLVGWRGGTPPLSTPLPARHSVPWFFAFSGGSEGAIRPCPTSSLGPIDLPQPPWTKNILHGKYCAHFYSGVIQYFAAIVNHLISFEFYICWLLWWLVYRYPYCGRWCCGYLYQSVSCIRYSKKRKFRPKMHQNALGGRAPPGPAGGASALPQTP